ncbi:hypothetical protein [Parvicella tangerina]|uniref:Uncharacterized protein n=1 Tax=Parvicella tangerina TaxID=2829795 RepID=A0A916NSR1_9FLAO|nr:hypothetical protein [Parvicella tangerina]CAG5084261.1 hypothetical protein CRYO30217_02420 [Parvicella tangerina]
MADSFKRILRTKSAEQLTNMYRNKTQWSPQDYQLIQEEMSNRGLGVFEEPEEWSDREMEELDLISPKTEFERDLAYLTKEKENHQKNTGIHLASQIVSISAVLLSFTFMYFFLYGVQMRGISTTFLLCMMAVAIGLTGLILFILKKYLPSIIVSGISLLLILIVIAFNINELM